MMEAFDICGEASAVLGIDFDLVGSESGFWARGDGDGEASICGKYEQENLERVRRGLTVHTKRFPRGIYFWPGGLAEHILFHERAVKTDNMEGGVYLAQNGRILLNVRGAYLACAVDEGGADPDSKAKGDEGGEG